MASQDSIQTAASDLPSGEGGGVRARSDGPPASQPASGRSPSAPETWALEPGTNFPSEENPKYRIKAEIDDGGMGIVYEAHQGELGVVAIKVIKPRILGHTASERFLNEARAMAKVRSESGIATIYDCDFYTDSATGTRAPYMVMEYIPGAMPITAYAGEHRLKTRERLALFERVCRAVGTAHRAEIIHRDLKPANVMVSSSGQPKVIDFGLAMVRDPNEHALRLPSERGGLFGTLEYMSPEQASKKFDPYVLTPASDVYSLGVILYELLLGRLPYEKHPGFAVRRFPDAPADYSEATRIIREEPPIDPHKVDPALHPELERILLRALRKDPSKRYAHAGEMADAIRAYLRGAYARDMRRGTLVAAAAVIVAYVAGLPAFFDWTPLNLWFQRAASTAAPTLEALQHVVLVQGNEKTDMASFGLDEGALGAGVGLGPEQRQRPVWAAVCRRLAESGCRVVAVDVLFEGPAPNKADDEAMMGALEALDAKGIETVLGTEEWRDRWGEASPMTARANQRTGAVWLTAAPEAWLVQVALRRQGTVMGSLALQSVAAWRHPGHGVMFDLGRSYVVKMKHGPAGAPETWKDDPKPIVVNRIVPGDHDDVSAPVEGSTDVYTPADYVALLYLPRFPPDHVLEASMIDAGALMRLSRAELVRRCKDKVVVVANGHAGFEEEFSKTPDGRLLPRSQGHALAIETMLQGTATIRSTGPWAESGVTFVAGLLGVALAYVLPGRFWAVAGWTAALLAGSVAASLLVLRLGGPLVNPLIPGGALLLGAGVMSVLPEMVRRFRVWS